MTQAQQSEAQRLAAICETKGMFPVADELNRMHARILELEQGKCLHQIAEPAAQGVDAQDAARWREVIQHVGAAPHFGGQHFTLNTLQAPDTSLGFKANLMSGSVAQHFTKAIDAARAAQAKQGEQANG